MQSIISAVKPAMFSVVQLDAEGDIVGQHFKCFDKADEWALLTYARHVFDPEAVIDEVSFYGENRLHFISFTLKGKVIAYATAVDY